MAVNRALISVYDKTGVAELASFLSERGWEILSTGGTAKHLAEAGVAVSSISAHTNAPEILGGRVKTLHPRIFGGILYDRDKEDHARDTDLHQIPPIDVVVVNLYPFEATVAREGTTLAEAIEQIDVGGPSMLRAAAKNHKHVLPLCDPSLYQPFMEEMRSGSISDQFRSRAAVETFRRTAAYDQAIASYLGKDDPAGESFNLELRRFQELRYGENPHQQAGFYVEQGKADPYEQIHGKELSYNNLLDLDAAWAVASAFQTPACAIIKHTNPCGTAVAGEIGEAVRRAIEADPVSAFGGIVGVNRELDASGAEALSDLFLEVVAAPSFSAGALELLRKKKNLRLIRARSLSSERQIRSAAGGLLIQHADHIADTSSWNIVTRRSPTDEERRGLEFAWTLCAYVKSNAIVITRSAQSVGIGAGQMSRVDAARIAVMKASQALDGCVAASDAFFPFRDGLDILADAGIKAVIQPGGSVRDEEVIAAADERGLAMVVTGERHFRH